MKEKQILEFNHININNLTVPKTTVIVKKTLVEKLVKSK